MSFEPNDLHRKILGIVDGLQHGKGRRRVRDDSPMVLANGVPASVIEAELYSIGSHDFAYLEVVGELTELTTRRLLEMHWLKQDKWTYVEYRRPDGRVVSTGLHPGIEYPEVSVDGNPVANEMDDAYGNTRSFACYWINAAGLKALDRCRGHGSIQPVTVDPQPRATLNDIPPLDKENGDWVDRPAAAKIVGREIGTLKNNLSGQGSSKSKNGLRGIDRSERMWRKDSKNAQEVWYLKSSLKPSPSSS